MVVYGYCRVKEAVLRRYLGVLRGFMWYSRGTEEATRGYSGVLRGV